jgi:glycosyltransferase involved in cell wall biosynthesis
MLVVPWDQEWGGVASVVRNLSRTLEGRGHRVVFLRPSEAARPERSASGYELKLRAPFGAGRPLRSVLAFALSFVPTLWRIRALLRAHQIEVVHLHYPIESFVYFGVLRWLLPARLVISCHGADLFPDGRRRRRYPWSLRFLVWSADALVAPSRAFLADCLSVFPRAARKAVCIHNGVDFEEFAGKGEEQGKGGGPPYLLCIAIHNEKKGLDVLLRAFAEVSESHREWKLQLVGSGPLRPRHEELARALSLEQRVEFLGARGRAEVARLLEGCGFFVLASRSEPFGLVVVEALACRKAVVACAVGGIPEIIEDGRSGLLVPPDDPPALARALRALLDDPELRESLAEAGYRRALACFGAEQMGGRHEGLYAALIDGGPIGAHGSPE